jgi:hypothetical protein
MQETGFSGINKFIKRLGEFQIFQCYLSFLQWQYSV